MTPTHLFPRQFVLGPREPQAFPGWRRVRSGPFSVAAHPDLPVTQASAGDTTLTLLGYVLDPADPAADDRRILEGWLQGPTGVDPLVEAAGRAAGRYALLIHRPDADVILHDAAGSRTVVHTIGSRDVWCASDAALLGAELGLEPDPGLRHEWLERTPKAASWFPVDATTYRTIRALVPNHLLDLRTGSVRRHWPSRRRVERPTEEVAVEAGAMLRRIMDAGRRRFPIMLGLTAGIDSRLILAASRDFAAELHCFTWLKTQNLIDVRVARQLLDGLGLAHRILPLHDDDPELYAVVSHSYDNPRRNRFRQALATSPAPPDAVLVPGYSVTRRKQAGEPPLDAATLARISKRKQSARARRVLQRWIDATEPVARRCDHSPTDLYTWESRKGRWAANNGSQHDFIRESFSSMSCRSLNELLLSASTEDRAIDRTSRLPHLMIRELWPELLDVPVNPHDTFTYAS